MKCSCIEWLSSWQAVVVVLLSPVGFKQLKQSASSLRFRGYDPECVYILRENTGGAET